MASSSSPDSLRFLVPLFSATLSALVVVGTYEVRARVRRPTTSAPDGGEPAVEHPQERGRAGVRSATASPLACGDLRRRYLLQCPHDLPVGAPEGAPPPGASPTPGSAARTAAELSAWLNPKPAELDDMARRCEIRFEMPAITENQPPAVTDEQVVALSLSARERALLDRTLRDMHTELRGFAQRALAEGAGPPGSTPIASWTVEDMLNELQTRPGGGFEEAREKLAQERATGAAPVGPNAQQPAGERLLRSWATLGDHFERQLATDLGTERARQLRASPQAGWMNRFSQAGCRSEPAPSPQ